MVTLFLLVGLWCLCGIVSAGVTFAYFQGMLFPGRREETLREDLGFSLLFGLVLGPIALVISTFLSGFWKHGWRLWRERPRASN